MPRQICNTNPDPRPKSQWKDPIKEAKDKDEFPPEDDSRSYRRFMIAQAAAGARHDGMLYEYHFDGDVLNSLGQKIIQAKYMKGGAQTFLAELDKARKKDKDRRTLISEEEAAK